ncbi:NUMOD4 motif [Bacteroidales bacterium Barb7]|nr:NUMOD4 motif [Bacteroidales bacterium Barb7]
MNDRGAEIWKDIEGYEGLYQVSNMGSVRLLDRTVHREMSVMQISGITLKPGLGKKHGYNYVSLLSKSFTVHRLVACAFLENKDNKPFIDHINAIRTDNRVENLRWCTPAENSNNPISYDRLKKSHIGIKQSDSTISKRVEKLRGRKITKLQRIKIAINQKKTRSVLQIDEKTNEVINTFFSLGEAQRVTGCHRSNISNVCKGKLKTCGGYKWRFSI